MITGERASKPSVSDLRVLIRGKLSRFDLEADNALVEEAARIAFELIREHGGRAQTGASDEVLARLGMATRALCGDANAPHERLRAACEALEVRAGSIPIPNLEAIEAAIAESPSDPQSAARAVQRLLDPVVADGLALALRVRQLEQNLPSVVSALRDAVRFCELGPNSRALAATLADEIELDLRDWRRRS